MSAASFAEASNPVAWHVMEFAEASNPTLAHTMAWLEPE
jgi:hypothetical protein